ncbi:MAG: hypothetical protein EA353_12685 [Puniceicoccaceae bacterium]|nr:MAG: hypothetical protein EA353_12685 [Puniceicoccaceae bacterium]
MRILPFTMRSRPIIAKEVKSKLLLGLRRSKLQKPCIHRHRIADFTEGNGGFNFALQSGITPRIRFMYFRTQKCLIKAVLSY